MLAVVEQGKSGIFAAMNVEEFVKLRAYLDTPRKIVTVTHKNPDGDAIGSSLGLFHYLKSCGHDVQVITPNDSPKFLKWMPGFEHVLDHENNPELVEQKMSDADVIFCLDFNTPARVGDMEALLTESSGLKVLIDHHQQPDDFPDYLFSDPSICATAQMVYDFIQVIGGADLIDANVATCLYTGIMTDTGSFRFPSTTATTHRVIADLIDRGANNAAIHNSVSDSSPISRFKLLGVALNNMCIFPEDRFAYITLSQEELDANDFHKGDTEGFVNYPLGIDGIVLSVILIESKKEGIIKISLRSKGAFSVNELSRKYFNGGGHNNAAGGRLETGMDEAVNLLLKAVREHKEEIIVSDIQ